MARFIRGEVVVVPFPFSSGVDHKLRPALVVASWPFESSYDYLLAMITTRTRLDGRQLPIEATDFEHGGLPAPSCVRPQYLFAAGQQLILKSVGKLEELVLERACQAIREVIAAP